MREVFLGESFQFLDAGALASCRSAGCPPLFRGLQAGDNRVTMSVLIPYVVERPAAASVLTTSSRGCFATALSFWAARSMTTWPT